MKIDVYISNISEDIWDFIQTMHEKEKEIEINENAYLSDRELLSLNYENPSILILPAAINSDFLEYYKKLFNNPNVTILTPEKHTGEICEDIINDSQIVKKLKEVSKNNTFVVKSYSATYQFYDLIDFFINQEMKVETPESPEFKDSWLVDFYGSKSGIRQLADRLGEFKEPWMGKGFICDGIYDVASLAASQYVKNRAIVLKTHKAHAGAGVKIFLPGDLPYDFEECYAELLKIIKKENYWRLFPVIVESYIKSDDSIGGGNPNCEYMITADNQLKLLFYCGMRVDKNGVFKGIEINKDVLPKNVTKKLLHYGEMLGLTYLEAGYRGYFDVDCVYTRKNELFITESNIRHTGGTHVYHAASRLLGSEFMNNAYILSHNTYPLAKDKTWTFTELIDKLSAILYDPLKKEGLIFASVNGLKHHSLGYIIIGGDKDTAYKIERKMERLLKA